MADKIYIFMRRDLRMRRGKEIAQACHAVLGLDVADMSVVTLKAKSESDLFLVQNIARDHGLQFSLVRDAGLTEIPRGTPTCIAVVGAPGGGQFQDWELY